MLSSTLGALALSAGAPAPAEACSPPDTACYPTVQLASARVPSDGVVAGTVGSCPGGPVTLRVLDAGGLEVPGAYVTLPAQLAAKGWFAFRPSTPWSVGATYTLAGPASAGTVRGTTKFSVDAPSSAPIGVEATLSATQRGVSQVRCAQYDPQLTLGTCTAPTFFSDSVREALIQVSTREPLATQHAYRIVWTADAQPAGEAEGPGQQFAKVFPGLPKEVCYELFATPLTADGVERSLRKECKTPKADDLGVRTGSFGSVTDTLTACSVPPEEYREQWCRTLVGTGGTCSGGRAPGTQACANARVECAKGAGTADAGTSDARGSHADGGSLASDDAGIDVASGDAPDDRAQNGLGAGPADSDLTGEENGGCSVRGANPGAALPWLVLTLLAGVRRVRRSRA